MDCGTKCVAKTQKGDIFDNAGDIVVEQQIWLMHLS